MYIERESISISDSSVRSSQCSKNFHKTFKTSYRSIKKVMGEAHNLSKRYSYFGKHQSATGTKQKSDPFFLQMLGFITKLREINVRTCSK